MAYAISRKYNKFRGLDLRDSNLTVDQDFSPVVINAELSKEDTLKKRAGYHGFASPVEAVAIRTFKRYLPPIENSITKTVFQEERFIEEAIAIGKSCWRLRNVEVSIQYSGPSSGQVDLYYDKEDGQHYCKLRDNGVEVFNFAMGNGLDRPSDIGSLITPIILEAYDSPGVFWRLQTTDESEIYTEQVFFLVPSSVKFAKPTTGDSSLRVNAAGELSLDSPAGGEVYADDFIFDFESEKFFRADVTDSDELVVVTTSQILELSIADLVSKINQVPNFFAVVTGTVSPVYLESVNNPGLFYELKIDLSGAPSIIQTGETDTTPIKFFKPDSSVVSLYVEHRLDGVPNPAGSPELVVGDLVGDETSANDRTITRILSTAFSLSILSDNTVVVNSKQSDFVDVQALNTPAAFLTPVWQKPLLVGTSEKIFAGYWSLIPSPIDDPLKFLDDAKNDSSFELPSSVALNNSFYICSAARIRQNQTDSIQNTPRVVKYDGQSFYNAGVARKNDYTASDTEIGLWNANTNVPTLANGVGVPGTIYQVEVAGTQSLGLGAGPITFAVGDYVYLDQNKYWINANEVPNNSIRVSNPSAIKYGTGSLNGIYKYILQYVQIDAAGNYIDGEWIEVGPVTATNNNAVISFLSISKNSGFNTGMAISTQPPTQHDGFVVFNVEPGHGLNIGDSVYFSDIFQTWKTWDAGTNTPTLADGAGTIGEIYKASNSGSVTFGPGRTFSFVAGDYLVLDENLFWQRLGPNLPPQGKYSGYVIERTNTTVSIVLQPTVDLKFVRSRTVISKNLRILIYRNKDAGTVPVVGQDTFYLIGEIANSSEQPGQQFFDFYSDVEIGVFEQFVVPQKVRGLPPASRAMTAYKGKLVVVRGGLPDNVAWSDEHPETFPPDDNSANLPMNRGSKIVGVSPTNDELIVYKDRGISSIMGDLDTGAVRLREIDHDLGCLAHNTIVNINGTTVFCSERGPYQFRGGSVPRPLGVSIDADDAVPVSRIEPFFTNRQNNLTEDQRVINSRAWAIHDFRNEKYILHIPALSDSPAGKAENDNALTLVYDYARDAWFQWDNMNMPAGMIALESGDAIFMEARAGDELWRHSFRRHTIENQLAYQDNLEAIPFEWSTYWLNFKRPEVLKKFIEVWFWSLNKTSGNENFEITLKSFHDFNEQDAKTNVSRRFVPSDNRLVVKLARVRSRSLRLSVLNSNEQENVSLYGWAIEMAPTFIEDFKP